jgi:hypothetical protein
VFDSFTVPQIGLGLAQNAGPGSDINMSVRYQPPAPGVAGLALAGGSFAQGGHAFGPSSASNLSTLSLAPLSTAGVTGAQVAMNLLPQRPGWSPAQPRASSRFPSAPELSVVLPGIGAAQDPLRLPAQLRASCLWWPTRSWTNWPLMRSCGEGGRSPDRSTSQRFPWRGWRRLPCRPIPCRSKIGLKSPAGSWRGWRSPCSQPVSGVIAPAPWTSGIGGREGLRAKGATHASLVPDSGWPLSPENVECGTGNEEGEMADDK